MNNFVEVIYGKNGEAYLALRKIDPRLSVEHVEHAKTFEKQESSRVVVIDMFRDDKEKYEC